MLYAQIGATDAKLRSREQRHLDLQISGLRRNLYPVQKVNGTRVSRDGGIWAAGLRLDRGVGGSDPTPGSDPARG